MTDHKPLIYIFAQRSDKPSPRQIRQLSFIAQFTTDIKHVSGSSNLVAYSLSRIESLRLSLEINLKELAEKQEIDEDLKKWRLTLDP